MEFHVGVHIAFCKHDGIAQFAETGGSVDCGP